MAREGRRMDESTMPLVITADEALLDETLRLCAAVGTTPVVAPDAVAARRSWKIAPVVLVGADIAAELARTGPARRDGVMVIDSALGAASGAIWQAAVELGARQVCALPSEQDDVVDFLANALDGRGEACVISVMGGSGGAGATTFAAALVLAAARRKLETLLLDADALGGGIDLVLGQENATGMRWRDLNSTHGRISGDALRHALPSHAGVSTISWDRGEPMEVDSDTVRAVLSGASRAFDLVVIDLPRRFDPLIGDLVARSVLTVLLVPEDIHALSSSGRVLDRLRRHTADVALLACARTGGVGKVVVGDTLGQPVLGRLRHDRRLGTALDDGIGPGRSRVLRKGCNAVLDLLGLVA